MNKMHIGIAGPIATADIAHLIEGDVTGLPVGYTGAPLLATLIGELLRLGHRVSAFTLTSDMPLNGGVVVVHGKRFALSYSPMRRRAWRPNGLRLGRILDLYAFEREHLQRAIAQAAPEVVHAHWTYEFALAVLQTGLPHVVTCHDSPYKVARFFSREKPTRSLYRWLRVFMARKVFRQARCVTAVSSYMRDEVQGMARVPIVLVPNPVDSFALALVKARMAPSSPRFAMVCNGWQAHKNPQPALKAFARYRERHPEAVLHLYGNDFGVGQTAEIWAKQQGIAAGMVFYGAIPHKQLLEALSNADMLLHPSLEESFGLSIAEAMAMGLPVVAGESSGAVPWVVGDGGVLCDVRQEQDIYRAIEQVLVPENYARYSVAARARVESMFTASAVASAYLETYKNALDKEHPQC
jgi:glycosyltransferase involved in cell wall biosynthesis